MRPPISGTASFPAWLRLCLILTLRHMPFALPPPPPPGAARRCRRDPRGHQQFDGLSLDPLETLFVAPLPMDGDAIGTPGHAAATLQRWQQQRPEPQQAQAAPAARAIGAAAAAASTAPNGATLASNDYLARLAQHKTPRILAMRAHGAACFDAPFYLAANPHLASSYPSNEALWRHFIFYGQFEYRAFRWACVGVGQGRGRARRCSRDPGRLLAGSGRRALRQRRQPFCAALLIEI